MACSGKAIIEEPKDVYLEFSDKAKLFRKFEPSPVERRVFELGKFSDWAPKELRGRKAYAVFAESIMKPFGKYDDPLYQSGSRALTNVLFSTWCGPQGTTKWGTCVDTIDTGYESGCTPPGIISDSDFSQCYVGSGYYAPALFAHSTQPSNGTDVNSVSAYAKPCPVASSTPDIPGRTRMTGTVRVRCVAGNDITNRAFYNRYYAIDSGSHSYSFRYFSLGYISSGTPPFPTYWTLYDTGASTTKGSTDVYYYIYTIGIYYAY